jgi:hypothetical protein
MSLRPAIQEHHTMISITRRDARRLRAVFRRHPLGIAPRAVIPPLLLSADPDEGLRIRFHHASLAVECVVHGRQTPGESVLLPLDALAEVEGRDDSPVIVESIDTDNVLARWEDKGIPRRRSYTVLTTGSPREFPELPPHFESCRAELLDALAEASSTTADSNVGYALNCIELRGNTHQVAATDGHQLMIQGGFALPWDGNVLVPRTRIFGCREIPRDRPVQIAKTASHVILRIAPWTVWWQIREGVRYPHIDDVLPSDSSWRARLSVETGDASFLESALERLPGADELHSPITLELNGRIAVRARGDDQDRATEVVLSRSRYEGEGLQVVSNREFLARALRLGFREFRFGGPKEPVACQDDQRTYGWQLLSAEGAIEPTEDVIRIESTTGANAPDAVREAPQPEKIPVIEITPRNGHQTESTTAASEPADTPVAGMSAMIQEAEALHTALGDASKRASKLVVALRRHRKRSKLMESTLAALKQLKLAEAV